MPIEVRGGEVEKKEPTTLEDEDKFYASFVFTNKTGIEICDMVIKTRGARGTQKTAPAGPPMVHVDGKSLKQDGTKDQSIVETDVGATHPDNFHATFKPCVKNESNFSLSIEFKRAFKRGESISFIPTDEDGSPVNAESDDAQPAKQSGD